MRGDQGFHSSMAIIWFDLKSISILTWQALIFICVNSVITYNPWKEILASLLSMEKHSDRLCNMPQVSRRERGQDLELRALLLWIYHKNYFHFKARDWLRWRLWLQPNTSVLRMALRNLIWTKISEPKWLTFIQVCLKLEINWEGGAQRNDSWQPARYQRRAEPETAKLS